MAEAAVAIGLDLDIRLDEASGRLLGDEVQVLDRQTAAQPLTLVVRLDPEDLILKSPVIEIGRIGQDLLMVQLNESLSIGVGGKGLSVLRWIEPPGRSTSR